MRDQKGQSIVEITLITPLLLLALYVPFDFGLAMYTASLAQNAVRDVARKAATADAATFNATTLQNEITSRLNGLATAPITPTVTKLTTGTVGCTQIVEASVSYTYTYAFYKFARLFGITVPNNTTITRLARMRYEFQPDSNNGAACTAA